MVGNRADTAPPLSRERHSTLQVDFAELSDCGRAREHNEDYLGHVAPDCAAQARSHGWLFVLADGVGGQQAGEVASRAAVNKVLAGFSRASPAESHVTLLARLMQTANAHVYDTGLACMATTLVACALRFDRAVIAHVGDSRCYLIRRGVAHRLTRDHTLASEQAKLGLLSPRQAAEASTRHLLSRSIGSDLFVAVDVSEHLVLSGDLLLLCSDGLHAAVPEAEIARITTQVTELRTAADTLVAIANERDGSDNVSVQLIRVRGVERVGMYRGRPYRLR